MFRRIVNATKIYWLRVLALLSVSLALFLPEVAGVAFLLVKGHMAHYDNVGVSVPLFWIATNAEDTLVVWKMPRSYLFADPHTIAITRLSHQWREKGGDEAIQRKWLDWESGDLRATGFDVVGEVKVLGKTGESYCIEGIARDSEKQMEVRCIDTGNMLYIVYNGSESFVPVLYKTIRHFSPE